MKTIKVAVGSKNQVKVRAVENTFKKVFGRVKVQSLAVDSGVSHTPASWEETVQGAINRARETLQKTKADFSIGLEGGYEKTKFGTFMRGAVAILDQAGILGISGSKSILLPQRITEKLNQGQELGKIMDQLQGVKNTKQKWGAMGFFTKGHSNRQEAFEQDVLCALARFLRKELY